jgi:hypothetical protein
MRHVFGMGLSNLSGMVAMLKPWPSAHARSWALPSCTIFRCIGSSDDVALPFHLHPQREVARRFPTAVPAGFRRTREGAHLQWDLGPISASNCNSGSCVRCLTCQGGRNVAGAQQASREISASRSDSTDVDAVVAIVRHLSKANSLTEIMETVTYARDAARRRCVTFVLREGDLCYYAEEDAISPLWKGKRFPMAACISDGA